MHDHSARFDPAKASGMLPEDTASEKPSPAQGSASIQCNGSGGYEIVYGGLHPAGFGNASAHVR
ncbi:MAG: hypothetical protein ABR521_02465, partial [Gaiellaceae bacterium]